MIEKVKHKTHDQEMRESDELNHPPQVFGDTRSDIICMYCNKNVRRGGGLILGICEECEQEKREASGA